MKFPRLNYGAVVLATGFTMTLVGYAIRNTFTVFYPVIVDDFGWSRGGTAIMYSLTMLSYGLVAPLAGGLTDRVNPKIVFSIGGLVVGGGIALCSLAQSMWHFYLFYGVMVAVGLSLIGFTPLSSLITHWFPKGKAQVFGLLGAGFGVSLVVAPIFQHLISEYGWRTAYIIVGVVASLIVIPACLIFIRRSPSQVALMAEAADSAERTESPGQPAHALRAPEWTVRRALRTRTYWLLLLVSFCNAGVAQGTIIAHQVYYFRDIGFDPMTAASVFSVFGVSFVAGTISSGLSDRLGRIPVFVSGSLVAAISILFLFAAQNSQSLVMPILFAICAGFGVGITPPTCFAGVADCFHGRNYGSIQGTAIMATALGAALGAWLAGFLHDVTGSYRIPFTLVLVAMILAAVLMWMAKPKQGVTPK
ncbi:MAG: MFS transporter [Dehalococcoidia bacterium]|nr:MAG: MFS transporter [Dehalococcoidia bacterium]